MYHFHNHTITYNIIRTSYGFFTSMTRKGEDEKGKHSQPMLQHS